MSIFREEDLTFEGMNRYLNYGSTLLIYVICAVGGIFISDLGIIFELISAITLSNLNFIWPGVFYLKSEKRYGNPKTHD